LIFKQEKLFNRAQEGNLGSRRIFLTVLAGHKKTLSGPLFAHPWSIQYGILNISHSYRPLQPVTGDRTLVSGEWVEFVCSF
jgi:hypothetical protein